jgi:tetratricopeptide (TPR) repeat protein
VQDLVLDLLQVTNSEEFFRWKQNHEVTDELITALMVAVRRHLDSGEFDSATRLADWCLLLAAEKKDTLTEARAAVTKGITLARVSDDVQALAYFDEAIRLYDEAGDEVSSAKVRVNRIKCYCDLSRYDDALRDAEISNAVFTRRGEKQLLARNLNNLGRVFFRMDRFQEWLSTLDQAGTILQEIGDDKSLALVYKNRAVALTSLNQKQEAIRYYRLSIRLAEESGQTWLAAGSKYDLGYLHYMQGEYTRALEILKETRVSLACDEWYRALCDLTQSEIYLEINMYRDAIQYAEAAHKGFESIEKPFEMAKAIGVMAIAHGQLREYKDAGRLFQKAKRMFKEQGNEVRAAGMDLHRGVMWLKMGLNADARAAALEAYDAFIKENVKPKAAFARVISARAALKLCELDTAAGDAAIADTLNEESPLPWVSHQLRALLGEIHQATGNLIGARTEFSNAIAELEDVRANIAADELRLNYLKDKVPVYEMLMNTDLQIDDPLYLEDAFETAERAKSRTLVDLLAGSVDALKTTRSSSLKEIQQALGPDTALIEYATIGDAVFAFCVSGDRFAVFRDLCSRAELRKRFGFLEFHLSRMAADPAAAAARASLSLSNMQDHLKAIYEMLVRPIEPFVARFESLVFVPSDFLHYLPFHALCDGSTYLADRFMISYAPTATIYKLFSERREPANSQALLIGVPDEAAPLIGQEIESVRSVLSGARTFVGPHATRECLKREMATAGIIHIASHAIFRPDNPMFSSLQLFDGPMNFFDIYNLKTSANLITLSGCGTGLSNVVAGDELLGLIRGFVYAGATSVVLSLWDVNDRTTADLMKYFYGCVAEGQSKGRSLQSAMLRLRQDHPHPYYWAPFVLMGNPY